MADYATVTQIKGLGIQTDAPATATTVWDDLATAASRMFDKLVEVQDDFFATANGTYQDRTFIGDGTAYLRLPPYVALADANPVMINEGTPEEEDYIADNVPEYAEQDGMLVVLTRTRGVWPYYGGVARFTGWPVGKQIEVSANWGFTATPKDVQIAVSKLALFHWRMSDPVNADNVNATAEPLIDGLPASVWPIVEKYRDKYSRKFFVA